MNELPSPTDPVGWSITAEQQLAVDLDDAHAKNLSLVVENQALKERFALLEQRDTDALKLVDAVLAAVHAYVEARR
jgi:hypothetical protein